MDITEKAIKDYMISQDVTFGWDNNIKEFEVSSFCRIYGKNQLTFFEYLENTISNWIITKRDQDINKIIND